MSSVEIEVRVRYRRGFSEREVVERVHAPFEHPPGMTELAFLAQLVAESAEVHALAVAHTMAATSGG